MLSCLIETGPVHSDDQIHDTAIMLPMANFVEVIGVRSVDW